MPYTGLVSPVITSTTTANGMPVLTAEASSLSLFLQANSAQRQNLCLLYGSSFTPTGPTTAYDYNLLNTITSASGYNQTSYLSSLQITANLCRALQGTLTQLRDFNKLYKTYVQPKGSPKSSDRVILFNITGNVNYTQTNFLGALKALVNTSSGTMNLSLALQASPKQTQNMDLLYGAHDASTLFSVASATGYNQTAFLSSLEKTAGLYVALQADPVKLQKFNQLNGATLQAQGTPVAADRVKLFGVTGKLGYDQAFFLAGLVSDPTTSLVAALQINSAQIQSLNLLYGTAFKTTGPSTVYDYATLSAVTSAAGYDQTGFLNSLQITASLYVALQTNAVKLQNFNQLYQTGLQTQGSPSSADLSVLFNVTGTPGYDQAFYLTRLVTSSTTSLIAAVQASPAQIQNLNLLYGTSFQSSGPTTDYDYTILSAITSPANYNQTSFLNSLSSASGLYTALQSNPALLAEFNVLYGTLLANSGSTSAADRVTLFNVTGTVGYNQADFLNTLAPEDLSTLFGDGSFWNTLLAGNGALNPNSANLVTQLVAETKMSQPWMNTSSWSTGIYNVDASTPKVPLTITQNGTPQIYTALYALCQAGVPIPANAIAAAGTDGHITILDHATDTLYEFWQLKNVNGKWQASWGGVIKNYSTSDGKMPVMTNAFGNPEYWGATATGLPVAGGTILLSELASGVIPHVLAMAIPLPKNTFVPPATRSDGTTTGANNIPEGTIFRLPANVYINPSWTPLTKMIVTAMRDYGVVVRDRSYGVTLYGEDPTQYGAGNPYSVYYGGKQLWDVMNQIPWAGMQATN